MKAHSSVRATTMDMFCVNPEQRYFTGSYRRRFTFLAISPRWRSSVPQHPPKMSAWGNRRATSPICSPSSIGSPSSRCPSLHSAILSIFTAFGRMYRSRSSHGPASSNAASNSKGCEQFVPYHAAAPSVLSSIASMASRRLGPDLSRPSGVSVRLTPTHQTDLH